jgi:hypothetical protein
LREFVETPIIPIPVNRHNSTATNDVHRFDCFWL